jgi:twitching motility protein PilT
MNLQAIIDKIQDTPLAWNIHLIAGMPPYMRRDGALEKLDFPVMTTAEISEAILPLMQPQRREQFEYGDGDALETIHLNGDMLRIHLFREQGNACATIRRAPSIVPRLETLGCPKIIQDLTHTKRGLIVCTGPVGSGKTTLMSSMVEEINQTRSERIHIIEEVSHYEFTPAKSLITHQLIGSDTPDYASALRSVVYSDPDVIMIGGTIPNPATLPNAISAAETGHLVFLQMHSNSVSEAIRQMIDAAPEMHRTEIMRKLSNNLVSVLSQQLLPKKDGTGRVAALEILIATPDIRQKLRAGQRDFTAEIGAAQHLRMQTMNQAIDDLLSEGLISLEVAKQYTT